MRSIGARLALRYALAATATLASLFVAGYFLLRANLVHGLDLLNRAEFAQITAHLGADYATLSAGVIEARIRETTDYASVLFYITIDDRVGPVRPIFYSSNLRRLAIPDVPGKHAYDTQLPGIGGLRAAEFILGPFDVTVATPLSGVREALRDYAEIGIWLMLVMLAVSAAIGLGLSRLALRPLRAMREIAGHIGSDNLGERIPVAAVRDEMSELALFLNQMFDRLESAFQQIRRFTAEASHELKTPLSLMRLQAEKLLVQGKLDAADEESVHVQLEELARMNQIIEELLFLSRAEARDIPFEREAQDPAVMLAAFAQDATVLAEHRGVSYTWTHQGAGCVWVEARWLRRVWLNVLSNALRASTRGARVTLHSTLADDIWRMAIDDEGAGVAVEFRERIFERFFRMPIGEVPAEDGSGLGLAICRSIITLHGGTIRAESAPGGGGLRVVLTLPASGLNPRQNQL